MRCRQTIIAVVMQDSDAMFSSEGLEGALGGDGFNRRIIDLGMHIS
jgi:hypothetical protein